MPVIAGGSSGAQDAGEQSKVKKDAENDQMEGVQDEGEYNDSRAEERPIGIKEDG